MSFMALRIDWSRWSCGTTRNISSWLIRCRNLYKPRLKASTTDLAATVTSSRVPLAM